MPSLNESIVEDTALNWLGELGCAVVHGPQRVTRCGALLPKTLSCELRVKASESYMAEATP